MQVISDFLSGFADSFVSVMSCFGIKDLFDIIIVALLIDVLLKFARERRAGMLALGVAFLLALELFGQLFSLTALKFILHWVLQMGFIAIVIVFQPELRSGLEKMGGQSIKSIKTISGKGEAKSNIPDGFLDSLCDAVVTMGMEKTGALIVIERETKLGDVLKIGTTVNADISSPLIRNIFFKNSPLHDGAMIVRDYRIFAAGCVLPLSTNDNINKNLGTRHRAGLGMSENSDAISIIVSEETGGITLAIEGTLERDFDYVKLKARLRQLLSTGDTMSIKDRVLTKIKTDRNGV